MNPNELYCKKVFAEPLIVQKLEGVSDRLDIRNSRFMDEPGSQVRGLHNLEYFSFLKKIILEIATQVFEEIYSYDLSNLKVEMTSMWFNKDVKGNWHLPHYHANNILSGVFFPDGDGNDFLPLNVMRPQNVELVPEGSITSWNCFNNKSWGCRVQKDTLYMFPSYLTHYVDPNPNDQERLSIAFDILIRGEYTDNKENGVTKHII